MKKFLTTSLLATVFSSSAFAASLPFCSDLHLVPYVGVDAAMRYSEFQQGYGGNVFAKHYPEGNISLGVKFSDYVGVEAGYKTSVTKTRTTSLSAGDTIVGVPIESPPEVHRSIANFKGWHAEIIGYLPIYKQNCISLLGSVGINRSELFAKDKVIQRTIGIGAVGVPDDARTRTFSKTKNILTIGTGIQFAIDEKVFMRLKINWENTSRFKTIVSKERADAILKPKDSFIYGIGIVFNFF